ncbi:hypothetical protein [Effusibacillus lacus]|uniref:hypothetical protein n=1 Tax=Effusibacillus lacus TaxID=1348429 RepID=UPI0010F11D9A|nr:hypothetical protein [Effusibacillus lacus]TCS72283.1 hypothetical protein EDD64_12236 [Effusibacillus lacus]
MNVTYNIGSLQIGSLRGSSLKIGITLHESETDDKIQTEPVPVEEPPDHDRQWDD